MTRASNGPHKSPLTQDDQPNIGSVGGDQIDGEVERERSQPQGSKPETRANSQGR